MFYEKWVLIPGLLTSPRGRMESIDGGGEHGVICGHHLSHLPTLMVANVNIPGPLCRALRILTH